jgi:cytochrome c-type protein NapB
MEIGARGRSETRRKIVKTQSLAIFGAVALVCGMILGPSPSLGADTVQSLRGDVTLPETNAAPKLSQPGSDAEIYIKAYRQQPPLIPHEIDKYEIDLKVNRCLRCHDWPYNVEEGAPKISETHYFDRDGKARESITRSRWFCTQCHVSQSNAKSLISNTFEPLRRGQ